MFFLIPCERSVCLPTTYKRVRCSFVVVPSCQFEPSSIPVREGPCLSYVVTHARLSSGPSSARGYQGQGSLNATDGIASVDEGDVREAKLFVIIVFVFVREWRNLGW